MKKITILSIVAAAILFTGCGDKPKEVATDATVKAVESTKEAATDATAKAVESTKEAASHVQDATKEASDSIAKAAIDAVDATKKIASDSVNNAKENAKVVTAVATATIADTAKNVAGAIAYVKCAGCHGVDGKTKALGKSEVIAGQSKEELVTMINGYKAGTIDVAGMGTLMKGQVASMDDASIEAVATYISTMK